VHAAGQVIAFTWPGSLPAGALARALDALLPADVGLHSLRRVPQAFSPRSAARYREYRYTVWNGPRSPLRERYALGVRVPLDVAAMAEAGRLLVGRHDFTAFGAAHRQPTRTLHRVRVHRTGRTVTIDVTGDAFLRQMVRSIVAALLLVGRGEASAEDLGRALLGRDRAFDGAVAPGRGLCLRRVVLGRRDATMDEDA
jgi:tRNA pseudouridine38-40 synthase